MLLSGLIDPSSPKGSYLSISFGWGIGVGMGVWVAGGISGGMINPAVTIALACFRGFREYPIRFGGRLGVWSGLRCYGFLGRADGEEWFGHEDLEAMDAVACPTTRKADPSLPPSPHPPLPAWKKVPIYIVAQITVSPLCLLAFSFSYLRRQGYLTFSLFLVASGCNATLCDDASLIQGAWFGSLLTYGNMIK